MDLTPDQWINELDKAGNRRILGNRLWLMTMANAMTCNLWPSTAALKRASEERKAELLDQLHIIHCRNVLRGGNQ